MSKKKNIPLKVLKALVPFVNKNGKNYKQVDSNKFLISFIDIDRKSDFHFNIEQYEIKDQLRVLVSYSPISEDTVQSKRFWLNIGLLNSIFKEWVDLLNTYEKTPSVFDDPILESHYQDYYADFEIIDDEKEKLLEPKIFIPLFNHFEDIKVRLNEYKDKGSKEQIEEIQNNIDELNNQLTKKNRQWVASKISIIWAKLTKMGVKYFKEFVVSSRKQIFKVGSQKMFDLAEKGIEIIRDSEHLN